MGLTITPIAPAEITISGTSTTVPSVYVRIFMGCNPDGITMSIGYETYTDKAMYQANSPINTDVPNIAFNVTLDPATQEQSITEALNFTKSKLETLGYSVVIDPSV